MSRFSNSVLLVITVGKFGLGLLSQSTWGGGRVLGMILFLLPCQQPVPSGLVGEAWSLFDAHINNTRTPASENTSPRYGHKTGSAWFLPTFGQHRPLPTAMLNGCPVPLVSSRMVA